MTTKKQRREQTAAKTAARRETERLENLEKLARSKHAAEQRKWDAERAKNKRAAAAKIKAMHKDKEEALPENMTESLTNLVDGYIHGFTPEQRLLHDIFGKQDA